MRIFSYRNKRALRRALLIALLAVVLIGLLILARISYLGRYAVYSPDGVYFDKTQKLQREDVPAVAPTADPEEYPFETILSASSGEEETGPDTAQLLPVHARIGAAGAQRKFHPGGLQLFHGFHHRRAGLRLPEGHQRIIKITYQKFVLHSFLLRGSLFSTSIPQIGTPWGFCCIKNRSRLLL